MSRSLALVVSWVCLLSGVVSAQPHEPALAKYRSSDVAARVEAAWQLGKLGRAAAPAVAELIAGLGHESDDLRWASAWALREIGPPASAALRPALASEKPTVRRAAAYALEGFAGDDILAMQLLIRAAKDSDPLVRVYSEHAFRRLGPQHAALRCELIEFSFDVPDARGIVTRTLWPRLNAIGPPHGSDAAKLEKLIAHENPEIWFAAMREAIRLGAAAAPLIPELRRQLKSQEAQRANLAVVALGAIGPQAQPAVDDVVRLLQAQVTAAGPLEPVPADLKPLTEMFVNKHKRQVQATVSGEQLLSLAKMQAQPAAAQALLLSVIRCYIGRKNPTHSDGFIPADADLARIRTLYPDDHRTAEAQPAIRALEALAAICDELPDDVLSLLSDPDPVVQLAGVRTIGEFGRKAKRAVPQLRRLLENKELNFDMRKELWLALAKLGPEAKDLVPDVKAAIQNTSRGGSQLDAIECLVAMAPASNEEILKLLQSDNHYTKLFTLRSLQKRPELLKADAAQYLPGLKEFLLSESHPELTQDAVKLLPLCGEPARDLVPLLAERMPYGKNKTIHQGWFRAMYQIAPDHPATVAIREYARKQATDAGSPLFDAALVPVFEGEHFDEQDARNFLRYGGLSEDVWKRATPRFLAVVVAEAKHEKPAVRKLAIRALRFATPAQHSAAVAVVATALDDADVGVRDEARSTLLELNIDKHPDVAATLLDKWVAQEEPAAEFRRLALRHAANIAPLVKDRLAREDESSAITILERISALGPEGKHYIAVVRTVSEGQRAGIASDAVRALRRLGDPQALRLPDLAAEALTVPSAETLEMLSRLGPPAAPTIARLLKDQSNRKVSLPLLRGLKTVRGTMPYAWLELDDALSAWSASDDPAIPPFLKRLASDARPPQPVHREAKGI